LNTSSIRIIGGRNKSYRIVFKASPGLRPTSDRAKETLFSWLQFEIENKSCLDLFAGTGGLGLEALSRGANHVTFVEKDKFLHLNIKKNINHLGHKNNKKYSIMMHTDG
jgi:N6-adenine-specific methylase